MNDEIDVQLLSAITEAIAPLMKAAREYGPLPSMWSEEFLTAPLAVRQAILAVGGSSYALHPPVTCDDWLSDDYIGGRFHRQNKLPVVTELMRRRYPPFGDREMWIKYGPDGPPPELEVAA